MQYSSKKSITYPEAKKKLEYYCSYQERCHLDIEQKLNEFHLIPEAKEKIIIYLIEENFLNETRFSKSFSRGKFHIKKWGKQRIIRELKYRKISDYNIKKGLQEIDEIDYLDSFNKLSNQKWEALKGECLINAKRKFINYLQYRGWENQMIFEKLNEITAQSKKVH